MRPSFAFRPSVEPLGERITPALAFASAQGFAVGGGPIHVATGDLNSDGRPDLVTANYTGTGTGTTISVLVNSTPASAGGPSFRAAQSFTVGNGATCSVVVDFNGDSRMDLAVSNYNADTVSILLNTTPFGSSSVAFAAQQTFAVGNDPRLLDVGDFNGDGRADLVAVNYNGGGASSVSVLLNTSAVGATLASFAAQLTFAVGTGAARVAVGDFNADGRPDLAASNYNANTVSILLNTTAVGATAAAFTGQQTFATGTNPGGIAVGDFNNDGRADVAVTNVGSNSVSVLVNATAAGAGSATFNAQQTFAVGPGPNTVAAADFNGDGRADLVASNYGTVSGGGGTNVSVLLNTAAANAPAASFAGAQVFAVGTGPLPVAVADFNADGRPDVTTADYQTGTGSAVSVLLNTSTGSVTTVPSLVGQFGGTGVWAYNRVSGAWNQLTGANANALSVAPNGNVVASFGGNGVWYYRPFVGWVQINGVSASALATDGFGNVVASFPGYGVARYRLTTGTWASLTTAVANLLSVNAAGDIAANFAGFGVYRHRPTTNWQLINGVSAVALAIGGNGDVAASFTGFGVNLHHSTTGWQLINGVDATALAVGGDGTIAANFVGYGVGQYLPYASGWRTVAPATQATSLAADWYGNVSAAFTGYGVWEFTLLGGWRQRRTTDPAILGLGA